jgi:hypothetical protein
MGTSLSCTSIFHYGKQCENSLITANHNMWLPDETAVSRLQMMDDQFFPDASISAMSEDVLLISNG